MKTLSTIIASLVFFGIAAFAMESETYKIDASASKMKWYGEKVSGEHFGSVSLKEGEIHVSGNKISQGVFTADMTSITVEDIDGEWGTKLLGHLKSDDFFSVAKHKESKFEIISVKDLGDNKTKIAGKLTIKGITKVISFETEYKMEGNKLIANAEVLVDRTKFDIKYRSGNFFEDLGDKMIYDNFRIELKIVAVKA